MAPKIASKGSKKAVQTTKRLRKLRVPMVKNVIRKGRSLILFTFTKY